MTATRTRPVIEAEAATTTDETRLAELRAEWVAAGPEIATRWGHRLGRQEFRAYPHGRRNVDGGAGGWYGSREQAENVLATALQLAAA